MSDPGGMQAGEGAGGKNREARPLVASPPHRVHPSEVFHCLSCGLRMHPQTHAAIWWPFGDPVECVCLPCRLALSRNLTRDNLPKNSQWASDGPAPFLAGAAVHRDHIGNDR